MTLVYGLVRRDRVIILGQALAIFIYVRNLMLIFGEGARTAGAVVGRSGRRSSRSTLDD